MLRKEEFLMATTRINSIHQHKGKNNFQTLKKCIDYINDENKRDNKENLVSTYGCSLDIDSTAIDFLVPKKIYEELVGRTNKNNILAYHLRQSFKPGEITPELANEIGYKLAEEVTKGEYQFIVATHTDKAHIHNHIIFNSTNIDGTRKYDEAYSWRKISKISDRLCLENNLSIVDNTLEDGKFFYKSNAYNLHMGDRKEPSFSDILKNNIKKSLLECPKDFEDFLNKMRDKGYEIKINKNIAFKGNGQKRFKRLSSLGDQYSEEVLREAIKLNYKTKLQREAEKINKVQESEVIVKEDVQFPKAKEVKKKSIVEQLNQVPEPRPKNNISSQEPKKSIMEQLNKAPEPRPKNNISSQEAKKSIMEQLNKAPEPRPKNNINNQEPKKSIMEQLNQVPVPEVKNNIINEETQTQEEIKKPSIMEQLNKNKSLQANNTSKSEPKKQSIMEQLNKSNVQKQQVINQNKINSFIELKDIAESKGAGYEAWASKYNLNELVKTFNYLSQNNLLNYEKLEEKINEVSQEFNKADSDIREISSDMKKISTLQNHIINFSKTKELYLEYRGTGYNQKFKKKHEEKILIHQEAKEYFKSLGYSKLPKMNELKKEYATLSVEKKKLYVVYNEAKAEKEKFNNIKSNIDNIYSDKLRSQRKSISDQLR